MNLREQTLIQAVQAFENIGFMEWHARILAVLEVSPQSIKEISRKTGLFHYHIVGVVQDLVGLQLVAYTRKGIQFTSEWEMLFQLVESCEGVGVKGTYDFEAAFEVAVPRVVALKEKYQFND